MKNTKSPFMTYPGLFGPFFLLIFFSSINVFCSSMVSVVVILISCQTVWSLWGIMSITDLRFQADPSALGHSFIPYVKTFGCWTESVPEFQWIFCTSRGKILMILGKYRKTRENEPDLPRDIHSDTSMVLHRESSCISSHQCQHRNGKHQQNYLVTVVPAVPRD